VSNSGFYFDGAKAIVLEPPGEKQISGLARTQLSLSNSALKAAQCIWIAQTPPTQIEIVLERNTFKGRAMLFLPEGRTDDLQVRTRNNIFTPGVLIEDRRASTPRSLDQRITWDDDENFYHVGRTMVAQPFIAPGGSGDQAVVDWPFPRSSGPRSRQGHVRYTIGSRGKAQFQPSELRDGEDGPRTPAASARFGADLQNVGPAPASQ
jgi:hypothetical protein